MCYGDYEFGLLFGVLVFVDILDSFFISLMVAFLWEVIIKIVMGGVFIIMLIGVLVSMLDRYMIWDVELVKVCFGCSMLSSVEFGWLCVEVLYMLVK